jgi:outer membrane protein assembly factor BamB
VAPSYVPPLVFESTAVGTLSSDGRRVYAVEDLAVPPPPALLQEQPGGHRPLGPLGPRIRYNRLLALDVYTGKPAWARGGESKPAGRGRRSGGDPEDDLHDCYFLGPPLPVSGRLYALVEKQGEVTLVCLDPAGGTVAWSQPLAAVREKLRTDAGRRLQAVHLACADGVLVCPTNAGAVVGVDLLSRSLRWAYTYHDAPAAEAAGGAPPPPPSIPADNGPAWKASAPVIHDGKVLFTAADDNALHCLRLHDSSPLWKVPRTDDDLYLAGVAGDRVLLVGKTACRAVSLADGSKTLWSLPTGLPSGQGIFSGDVYYLPLQQGGLCALDVVRGEIVARADVRGGDPPGNLLFHDGDLLSQSVTGVAAYPQLRTKLAALAARLAKDPRDPAALAERGDVKLTQGDLEGAVADLRHALAGGPSRDLAGAARDRLYDALTRLLHHDFRAGERYLDEYRQLCRVPMPDRVSAEERARLEAEQRRRQTNLLCLLARGQERHAGRPADVLRTYLALYRHDAGDQLVAAADDAALKERFDVWVRSRVATLFARGDAGALHEVVAREWRQARSGDDPAALERLAGLFGSVCPEGREARLLRAERLLEDPDRGRALEAELLLVRLRHEAEEPVLAARATEALARLLARKGLLEDAVHYYRLLASDFGRVPARDGKTGADFLDDLRADKRFLPYLEAPARWAGGRIRAEKPPDLPSRGEPAADAAGGTGPTGPQVITFQFQGELTPYLESHLLVLDLITSRLKLLDRPTGTECWGEKVALDHLRGHLIQNGLAGSVLPCPVQGHLAVVSLGAVVYGVDLLDRRVCWKKPLTDGPFLPDRMAINSRDGDGDNYHALQLVGLDRFGRLEPRVLGRLGPVGAAHVTIHTPAGLVALDPVRGETLWVRGDVAPDAESFGDERDVYLVERNGSASRAVAGTDGTVVAGVPGFGPVYAQKVQGQGRRLLLAESSTFRLVLRLYDVRTGKDLWRTEPPKDAVLLHSDDGSLAGWVGRDGRVVAIDLRTYQRVLAAKIDPAHVAGVKEGHLLRDGRRLYLAFNGDPDPNARPAGEPFSCVAGMRGLPVNGMVYAFDQATGQLCWFNRVTNQMLLLDQFEQLPIVLFADGVNRQQGGNAVPSVQVLSIDKQTGKRLLGYTAANASTTFHALRVDVRGKTIDLIGPNLRIRHYEAPATK